jgi:hypothetical protein
MGLELELDEKAPPLMIPVTSWNRELRKYQTEIIPFYGRSFTKDDLNRRIDDFEKHYSPYLIYHHTETQILLNNEPILTYKNGIPAKWLKQKNVFPYESPQ